VLSVYALSLNALLWVSRLAVAGSMISAPSWLRWALTLLAPCALFAATLRLFPARRAALSLVTAVSIGAVGLLA
jgi:hypothetical protein